MGNIKQLQGLFKNERRGHKSGKIGKGSQFGMSWGRGESMFATHSTNSSNN